MKNNPLISVIVPMHNSSRTIEKCINSLIKQTYKNYEIIVVDDYSNDNSVEITKKLPVKLIVSKKHLFQGGARNLGVSASKGDIIAFTDSDCVVDKNWLNKIIDTFSRFPNAGGVGGAVINPHKSAISFAEYFLNFSEYLPMGDIREKKMIPTLNVAYKKEAIKNILFKKIRISEDVIFNDEVRRKNFKLIFNPEVLVYHYHQRMNLKKFLERQKYYGFGFVYTRTKYNLSGKFLLKNKWILLFFPRLFLIGRRIINSGFLLKFLKVFPLILLGELSRTIAIFNSKGDENELE